MVLGVVGRDVNKKSSLAWLRIKAKESHNLQGWAGPLREEGLTCPFKVPARQVSLCAECLLGGAAWWRAVLVSLASAVQ